jgi:hypothetical protein
MLPSECDRRAEQFNRECGCATLNREALRAELLQQPDGADLYRMMVEDRPHLFADAPVFVPETCVRRQAQIVAAVERVIALPAYRQRVLAYAPDTAQYVPKAQGVFFGYDFHVDATGPRLIEINSNAGGALLNAPLLRAQQACDAATAGLQGRGQAPEQIFWEMFLEEWRLERGDAPLRRIAIVDAAPESQFLYPEFLLCRNLFRRNGVDAVVCDPGELLYRDGKLLYGGRSIDLVYNRLTDFGLHETAQQPLRAAYLAGASVVTPHPRAHALYADKRNLALLTDAAALTEMGVDAAVQETLLDGIAHTAVVRETDAERLWAERKRLFFKPAAGYGGKAAYRGDKLTRRVFEEILRGDYVAQALVLPSRRRLSLGGAAVDLKLDLRNYVYRGRVQMLATRLYQGQTTNFRTPGGGFAPLATIACDETVPVVL